MKKNNPLVLIVDDNATNIDLLVNTLESGYRLGIAKSGPEALDYVNRNIPDLILLDIMMPEMDGYEVCNRLKASPRTQDIAIIFITAMDEVEYKTRGFGAGAVDYITKPFHASEVRERVRTHLALKSMREELNAQNIVLEQKVREKTAEIQRMLRDTIKAMALTVESRDPYTAGHQQRVAHFACAIASKMGLSEEEIYAIRLAGTLHDIGKIRIPESILHRPGKLLDVEFELIKIHPQVGFDILKDIPANCCFASIIYQHHERLDGSGYPQGLSGDSILMEAKILAVADVIEAMSSYRPYRPALGINAALEEVVKNRGKIFDSDVVDACLSHFSHEGIKV